MNQLLVARQNNLMTIKVMLIGYGFRKKELTPQFLSEFNVALFKKPFNPERFKELDLLNETYKELKEIIDEKKISSANELSKFLLELREKEAQILITMSLRDMGNVRSKHNNIVDKINIESAAFLKAQKRAGGIETSHCSYIENIFDIISRSREENSNNEFIKQEEVTTVSRKNNKAKKRVTEKKSKRMGKVGNNSPKKRAKTFEKVLRTE
jgi:hypothetical protein